MKGGWWQLFVFGAQTPPGSRSTTPSIARRACRADRVRDLARRCWRWPECAAAASTSDSRDRRGRSARTSHPIPNHHATSERTQGSRPKPRSDPDDGLPRPPQPRAEHHQATAFRMIVSRLGAAHNAPNRGRLQEYQKKQLRAAQGHLERLRRLRSDRQTFPPKSPEISRAARSSDQSITPALRKPHRSHPTAKQLPRMLKKLFKPRITPLIPGLPILRIKRQQPRRHKLNHRRWVANYDPSRYAMRRRRCSLSTSSAFPSDVCGFDLTHSRRASSQSRNASDLSDDCQSSGSNERSGAGGSATTGLRCVATRPTPPEQHATSSAQPPNVRGLLRMPRSGAQTRRLDSSGKFSESTRRRNNNR